MDNGETKIGYDRVEAPAPTPKQLQEYAGFYYSPELDVYWTMVVVEDKLMVRRKRPEGNILKPIFADAFTENLSMMGDCVILFDRDADKTISGFRISAGFGGLRHLKFYRQGV